MDQERSFSGRELQPDLIPARMLNEYVYCPRLAYMMWVQGEFAHSADTVEGAIRHQRVDRESGNLPDAGSVVEKIHARSVSLSSSRLGITAKIDLVEGGAESMFPVDYKKGKRPHVAAGAYDPERVQVCVQGLLLREHGYSSECGFLYFIGSKERIKVLFDDDLIALSLASAAGMREMAKMDRPPDPLEDSPKCARCSLLGICLPDEVRFLNHLTASPRPVSPSAEAGLPLYVQSPRAYLRKDGDVIIIEEKKEKIAEARIGEVSQLVLFGSAAVTTPVLHECFRRNIPVTYLSYGGWFLGHTIGTGHKNVETRTNQYRASFDPKICLRLARGWVAAKIANCRTLLRRNWKEKEVFEDHSQDLPRQFRHDIQQAARAGEIEVLLGVEGNSARRYFQNFEQMLIPGSTGVGGFQFDNRNRRPPKDPVNAMLSFAYAMLTREWTIALSAVGLDPYRGFYHKMRFGRPALALDMMEPFRPLLADSVVITAINNREVTAADFIQNAVGCNLTTAGRKRFIATFERRMSQETTHPIFKYRISYRRLLEVQSRLLCRFLSGEIPRYPNFITR